MPTHEVIQNEKPLRPPNKKRIPRRTGLSPLEVCRKAKRMGINKVVLAFSGGKDSCAGWLMLRQAGIEVVPVYKCWFPDLDLDKNTVAYYSKFFGGVKIHMILHHNMYVNLHWGVYADPVTLRTAEKIGFKGNPQLDDIQKRWQRDHGLGHIPTAMCIKKGDSAQRMMAILRKGGEISTDLMMIYPMANASDKMCYEILIANNCPLPSFYLENFESRDSLRITTIDWIRHHAARDWEKIKFWCPLIETEYTRLNRKLD
jgi:hypothetical protein